MHFSHFSNPKNPLHSSMSYADPNRRFKASVIAVLPLPFPSIERVSYITREREGDLKRGLKDMNMNMNMNVNMNARY